MANENECYSLICNLRFFSFLFVKIIIKSPGQIELVRSHLDLQFIVNYNLYLCPFFN